MLKALLDGRVFADRVGPGEPDVLALHGWGRNRQDLAPAVLGRSALLLDLPGFGASPPPPEPWGTADYASFLAPLLTHGRWTLIGHSFGGKVAVQLAAACPEWVAGLVLTGVPLLRGHAVARGPAAFRVARSLHRRKLLSDVRMDRLRHRYGSSDYKLASGTMRSTLVRVVNEDYREVLPRVAAPVELVWGAKDTAAPLAMVEEAAPLFPNAELSVSETSGHLLDPALYDLLTGRLTALAAAIGASPRDET